MKHETTELQSGQVIHYSGLEGAVSFACGAERHKGDLWSQYQFHVSCPACKNKIAAASQLNGDRSDG